MALHPLAQARLDKLGFISLDQYYDSKIWSDFRNLIAQRYREHGKWYCWACKRQGKRFDLHHVRYNNFACFNTAEIKDIRILCKPCHSGLHALMKRRGMTLREATEYVMAGELLKEQKPVSIITRITPTIA